MIREAFKLGAVGLLYAVGERLIDAAYRLEGTPQPPPTTDPLEDDEPDLAAQHEAMAVPARFELVEPGNGPHTVRSQRVPEPPLKGSAEERLGHSRVMGETMPAVRRRRG